MFRLLLRPILLLTLLAALPIFAIRAQPYDDSDLRAFLTPPEGCPAPCFMGIRPGVTTAEEAIAILQAHEWVAHDSIVYQETILGVSGISWQWSAISHTILDKTLESSITVHNNLVTSMLVNPRITLGDVLIAFGVPEESKLKKLAVGFNGLWTYNAWYSDKCLWVSAAWSGRQTTILDLQSIAFILQYDVPDQVSAPTTNCGQ